MLKYSKTFGYTFYVFYIVIHVDDFIFLLLF